MAPFNNNVQVNSSHKHPLRANPEYLKKIGKCPALRVIFLAKAPPPVPTTMVKCPAPSPSDQYTEMLFAIFK